MKCLRLASCVTVWHLDFDPFVFADNGSVFSTHLTSTTLNSAGFGFNVRPGPVTFSAESGFPLRTALPAQKNPRPYARVSVRLSGV
jgi:hypothetical protein